MGNFRSRRTIVSSRAADFESIRRIDVDNVENVPNPSSPSTSPVLSSTSKRIDPPSAPVEGLFSPPKMPKSSEKVGITTDRPVLDSDGDASPPCCWSHWREVALSVSSADHNEESYVDEGDPEETEDIELSHTTKTPGDVGGDKDTTQEYVNISQDLVSNINSLSSLSEMDSNASHSEKTSNSLLHSKSDVEDN